MNKGYLKKHPELNPAYNGSNFMMEQQYKKMMKRRLFDPDKTVYTAKKYSVVIAALAIIIIPILIYWFVYGQNSASAQYFNTYYGASFKPVTGLISSIENSLLTGIEVIQNPYNIGGTAPPPTINTTQTFKQFLVLTAVPNQVITMTNNPQLSTILYSIKDNANVPLGSGTPNNVLVSLSCGSTVSQQSAKVCQDMLSNFTSPVHASSPPVITNLPLISEILPSETIDNSTSFYLNCPLAKTTFPTGATVLGNFTIKNYTAATILPIEFVSYNFNQKLLQASQPVLPSVPSVNFVTPGPIQVELSVPVQQPISTQVESVPINVKINDIGTGSPNISTLVLFVSKQFYPSNPTNGQWTCTNSFPFNRGGFQFPGSGYWACTLPASQLKGTTSFIFSLPHVATLGGLHFNTMSVIAGVVYNYNELLNIPFIIDNETCT